MTSFRQHLIGVGLAPRSVRIYQSEAQTAESWCDTNGVDLATIGAEDVAEYLRTRRASWATRKAIRSTLGHYWTWCGRAAPPIGAVRVPPKPRMVCRALEPDDARILAKAARHRGDGPGLAVALGLYLGLRREEIATLRWAEVDLELGWATITGKGGVQAGIPIHPVALRLLADWPCRSSYIFPGRRGGPCSPATIWHWTRLVASAAGVGKVTTHQLRHTCLATMHDATGDLRATQTFARHARPETTAGYTRTTSAALRRVVAALDF